MIAVPRETCRDFAHASALEWLESNGTGGFAMGTVAGTNTRRYHGLLVASLRPPVDRHVLLSRLDEAVLAEGMADVPLATNQYPGTVSPQGFTRIVEFRLDPFPTWVFDAGAAEVEKTLFLVPGEQSVVVQYRATRPCRLAVSPFLAFRDYHSLTHANPALDGSVREARAPGALTLRVRPYAALPGLSIHVSPAAELRRDGCWYCDNEYLAELDRGLDFREDLWKLGTIELQLDPDRPAFVAATIGARTFDAASIAQLENAVREQRRARSGRRAPSPTVRPEADGAGIGDAFAARLELAADQFVARRADGRTTLIAGYPWFTDWGRDTMIALPGILVGRGLLDEAREVLRGFLAHLDRGLIPNRFPDSPQDRPEYNTVDATLWMFQAASAYLQAGGETRFLRDELYPAAKEIVRWHLQGTHHAIRVDPADRLLAAGEPGVQLTWMDARVGDRVITPRHGKPVEINALWYNALRLMALWGHALGDAPSADRYAAEAALVGASFERAFWNEDRGCLFDVVDPYDAAIRPNQLFAISLAFPLLPAERRKSVVQVVEKELLTPYGLRTLARGEPGYVAHYRGGVADRDGAYHQGTVWPWLFGPYVRAYLAAFGRSAQTLQHCGGLLRNLESHLEEACLGSVSEVFDAEPPHRPGGAPAQAWSVAELLQIVTVDLAEKPRRERAHRGEARP